MSKKTMPADVRFFYDHAGYSWDPKTETKAQGRRRCAEEYAHAERSRPESWSFKWDYDPDIGPTEWLDMMGSEQDAPDEVLSCVLVDSRGQHLASLWGIADPDRNYRRVIEAELTMEATDMIQREVLEVI